MRNLQLHTFDTLERAHPLTQRCILGHGIECIARHTPGFHGLFQFICPSVMCLMSVQIFCTFDLSPLICLTKL